MLEEKLRKWITKERDKVNKEKKEVDLPGLIGVYAKLNLLNALEKEVLEKQGDE